METTVEKLETMFMKSEADLEYIERRLKLDFINSAAAAGRPAEENVAVMLENLKAIKTKHSLLRSELKEISDAQHESMESVRNNLSKLTALIRHCQQTSDLEVESLTESERESALQLCSSVTRIAEVFPAVADPDQQS